MIEAKAAEILQKHWDGIIPVDAHAIARKMGVVVRQLEQQEDHVLNKTIATTYKSSAVTVITLTALAGGLRYQFAIAHALAHIALGHVEDGSFVEDTVASYCNTRSDAICFTLALLIPKEVLSHVIVSDGAVDLKLISKKFGVSTSAMEKRVEDLGLFDHL